MRLVLISLFCLLAQRALAQDAAELFTQTAPPSTFMGQHPASFFEISAEAFYKALLLADNKAITLSIDLPTLGTVEVVVARYRVIDQNTTITAMTANGPRQVPPPKSVLLRGRILTIPDSYVVLAVYEDWATGLITTGKLNGDRSYRVSPLGTVQDPRTMVIYDAAKVPAINDWNCGTIDPVELHVPNTKGNDETQAVTFRKVTVSIECDEPYFIDHGRDITKATQYAEAIVAASSAVYERDVQATLVIGSLLVWTTVDPYTSNLSDEMLVQFRDRWRSINGSVVRSLAHLLSGTNNIGGIAYVDQLCSKQWGYAVSGTNNNVNYPDAGYVWDTDVFSHELGHNIGSPHTHACSWAPPIDSCYNSEGGCFAGTKPRKGTIMSYCHLTASGTDLSFHSRVVTLMQGKLNGSACTPLIVIFEVTVPTTVDVCAGNAATVAATVIGGTGRLSYRWRATGIDTVTQVATFQHVPTVTKKLFITVTDSLGSSTNDSTLITVNAKPLAQLLTMTPSVCRGTVVEITSAISGGRLPYSYRWFRNGIVIDTVADMVWPRIDSTSLVKLIVTDMNGCGDTADITITVPDNKLAIVPSRYVLPSLAVCEVSVAANITLRNEGLEKIIIDSVKSGTWLSVGTTLPIILAPASAQQIVLNIALKKVGTVVDTVVFVERLCGVRFKMPVSGNRYTPQVLSALPIDMGAKLVCDTPTVRKTSMRINNQSAYPIQILDVLGQKLGNGVSLANGPVIIPAASEQAIEISTLTKRLPGVFTDSLMFRYISQVCEGTLVVPTTMSTIGLTIDHPSSIYFDTVLTSQAENVRAFQIRHSLIGSSKTTVQSVRVDGPFTTSMKPGLIFYHGKQTQVTVTLVPSQFTSDGEARGALTYTLDSCHSERTITLSAIVRTVGVNDEQQNWFGDYTGEVRFYDLRGLLSATVMHNGSTELASINLPRGMYIAVGTNNGSVVTRRVIFR